MAALALPLPRARGPVSATIINALEMTPGPIALPPLHDVDMLADDDAQLALTCCYELHYGSFHGVSDAWEWNPALMAATASLEQAFLARLGDEAGAPSPSRPDRVVADLQALASGDGPSLSRYMVESGTYDHMREFVVHRSLYQRKEADGHTWAIPRLRGRPKAAIVAIQHDEYGGGVAGEMHAELFATTMQAFDLDPTYGAYLDQLPGTTLATDNLVTMLGLHRRWHAACVGHLALFEMTSVEPMARYSNALRRLGVDADARRFYDVHVAADAWHEQLAQREMVAGLVGDDPVAAGTVLFGARALTLVESRLAQRLLDAWSAGRSSLLDPATTETGGRVALAGV